MACLLVTGASTRKEFLFMIKYSCKLARDTARQQKAYHDKIYINYRKESKDKSRLTKQQLEDKLDDIISEGYKQIPHTTIRKNVSPKSYSLCYNERRITLSTYDGKEYH